MGQCKTCGVKALYKYKYSEVHKKSAIGSKTDPSLAYKQEKYHFLKYRVCVDVASDAE